MSKVEICERGQEQIRVLFCGNLGGEIIIDFITQYHYNYF